jgi:TonB family protein
MIQKRTKRNSSKVNLIISVVFHSVLVAVIFYFAAREGMLGKKLKQLAVTMVKEKPPEPPKPKQEEPKPETPKVDAPKPVIPPPVQTAAAPPPSATQVAPAVAPPTVSLPSFDFSDGAKEVSTVSDPTGIYKALIEHAVRSHWSRPEDLMDEKFVAEVEFTLDNKGVITASRWMSGSGDARWDNSVKTAVAQVKSIGKAPPKGFPPTFVVRFDVETTGDGAQISSR